MSAIVSFYLLPTEKLIGLREVWPDWYDYLNEHAEEYFDNYGWSGYCIAALIDYLKEQKKIDLGESDYNLLFPGAYDEGTWFLDRPLRDKYLTRFDAKLLSEKDLKSDFLVHFGGDSEQPMLDGMRLIKKSLQLVNDHRVMVVHVG